MVLRRSDFLEQTGKRGRTELSSLFSSTPITRRLRGIRAKTDSDHETGLGLMRHYNRARRLRAVK